MAVIRYLIAPERRPAGQASLAQNNITALTDAQQQHNLRGGRMQKYGLTMMAASAALAIASTASAQSNAILRVTGSTAYRATVHNAILAMIDPASLQYGYSGTKLSSASYAEFTGALLSDESVTCDVKVAWSGSVDGIQRIINQSNPAYYRTDWPAYSNLSSTGTPNEATGTQTDPADAAMSDVFQNSTIFQTPTIPNDVVVGVIPFEFCRNAGAPAALSNMTSLLAQQILSAGSLTLKFWTLNTNDDSTLVRVVGRNFDSGTRVTGFAETGFGVGSSPNQSAVYANSANIITNVAPYPAETLLGQSFGLGQSGYSSGGLVSGALNAFGSNSSTNTGNKGWLVGYLGVSDANNVTNGAAMTYNGIPYSVTAVENGQYTYWGYEHQYYNNNLTGGTLTVLDALQSSLETTDPTPSGGIPLAGMTVGRTQEGAPVSDGRAY